MAPFTEQHTDRHRGRFAPSPSGPLHFGSLVAALGSFLSARATDGEWLLRIDDVDPPRAVPGAADGILRTLERYQLLWDGPVLYQSQRFEAYADALTTLAEAGHSYPCGCTRKEISAVSPTLRYPGTCRNGLPAGRQPRAVRVRCDDTIITFDDALQGPQQQNLYRHSGDFIVHRADGFYAYHLATALDDAHQGITAIVRGADLLAATFPQLHLQQLLDLPRPRYLHLPIAATAKGNKLSKQTSAPPISEQPAGATIENALHFLGHSVPKALKGAPVAELLQWAISHWQLSQIPHSKVIPVTTDMPKVSNND